MFNTLPRTGGLPSVATAGRKNSYKSTKESTFTSLLEDTSSTSLVLARKIQAGYPTFGQPRDVDVGFN